MLRPEERRAYCSSCAPNPRVPDMHDKAGLTIASDMGWHTGKCISIRGEHLPLIGMRAGWPASIWARLIPDQERIESFWLFGLHGNVGHDVAVQRGAGRPVQQVADVIGWSLEGCLDAAVGKVTYPSAHAMLQGHPPAGGAEVDALDLTGDQAPDSGPQADSKARQPDMRHLAKARGEATEDDCQAAANERVPAERPMRLACTAPPQTLTA